ncbi:MAG: hypothetical protein ACXW3O_05310 [Brevundimonas sp.]
MSEAVYFTTLCLMLGTVLLVFGMRYFSAVTQARARAASEDSYRQLAESTAAAQPGTAAALSSIQATLADVDTRLAAIEKILKDVG